MNELQGSLEARGVTKRFGEFRALEDVDLDVAAGEIHALIGPNGAGKTTFFGVVSGELRATAGSVRFAGRELGGMPAWRRTRLGMARAFQIARVFPTFTVEENVRCAVLAGRRRSWLIHLPESRAGADPETREFLRETDLERLAPNFAGELSHGDRKRLEIAMALALRPSLLLLDEPTAGMSAFDSAATVRLIRDVWQRHSCSVLLTEHDMPVVFELAHRITVLDHGRVLRIGAPQDIARDPAVREVYLGKDLES
ncbi:MAG: ABC transporter ATP-binding protein [Chloroflexota bacterium]|nr:ABC transporter ATP-binding protein [Chloroflexota bacterium]